MQNFSVPFAKTGYFSTLINDYVAKNSATQHLYHRFPSEENFLAQIIEKQKNYNPNHRNTLANELKKQYESFETIEKVIQNIEKLRHQNTFTITTGHQLNLFTGPLYFIYKIINTIKVCEQIQKKHTDYQIVPVYWMATEDHDFEEINYFNYKNHRISWKTHQKGAVGEFETLDFEEVSIVVSSAFGKNTHAETLKNWFIEAYQKHQNLADATRFLAHKLFGHKGLVIIDANSNPLKNLFTTYLTHEILYQKSFTEVTKTDLKNYHAQIHPREINLFYKDKNIRERIVFQEDSYHVLNTNIRFTKDELLNLVENFPEKLSPNVVVRPLYQEVILPNLCYIGGAGEIAYWMQLKNYFDAENVPFPILLVRNSMLLVSEKQFKKLQKLNISVEELFLKTNALIDKKTKEFSNISIDFTPQKEHLKQQFQQLYTLAQQTDVSFLKAVKAQEIKQIKGLENLEKKLLRAQKKKYSLEIAQITTLKSELFPAESLQERTQNFAEFFEEFGSDFLEIIYKNLEPLSQEFKIIVV